MSKRGSIVIIAISLLAAILVFSWWKYSSGGSTSTASDSSKPRSVFSDVERSRDKANRNKPQRQEREVGNDRNEDVLKALDQKTEMSDARALLMDVVKDNSAKLSSRLEAFGHFKNLWENPTPEDKYTKELIGLIADTSTPRELLEEINSESLNIDDATKLHLQLAFARHTEGDLSDEAVELLQMYVEPENDPGRDWQAWEKLLKDYLKKQQDAEKSAPAETEGAQ